MKLYSDHLTPLDIYRHTPPGTFVDECEAIRRPRLRKFGWKVKLGSTTSRRYRNSGTHGAATWESNPASWDDYGHWLSKLFDVDPNARLGPYTGRAHFHESTDHAYHRTGVPA